MIKTYNVYLFVSVSYIFGLNRVVALPQPCFFKKVETMM